MHEKPAIGWLMNITERWNTESQTGKNFKKLEAWTDEHTQSGITKFFDRIHLFMDKAGIDKGESLEVVVTECLPPSEKKEFQCQNCGRKHVKNATRITYRVNGQRLLKGEVGEVYGDECFANVTYVAEAAKREDFELPIIDERQRKQEVERLSKVKISLDQLSKKTIEKLREMGYDLDTRIPAEAADEIQKSILKGDHSLLRGIEGCNDLVNWGIREFRQITDPDIKYTIALMLTKQFKRITAEQWNEFLLYAWQNRLVGAKEELAGIKEDIIYLSSTETERAKQTVEKYKPINLEQELIPIKLFDKTAWENITLNEILYNREKITKAQSRAVRRTVPYLQSRRVYHNRTITNSYCPWREFSELLEKLEKKYENSKQQYIEAKKQGIKAPDNPWKDSYKRLKKSVFDKKEKIERTEEKMTLRELILKHTPMPEAEEAIKTLYVEGRKLELAEQFGEDILRYSFITTNEAAEILAKGGLYSGKKIPHSHETINLLIEALRHKIIPTICVQRFKGRSIIEEVIEKSDGKITAEKAEQAMQALAEAYDKAKKFYEEHDAYNYNTSTKSSFYFATLNDIFSKAKDAIEYYKPLSEELKQKIRALNQPICRKDHKLFGKIQWYPSYLHENIEEVIDNPRTVFAKPMIDTFEREYAEYERHVKEVQENRDSLKAKGYDIGQITARLQELQEQKRRFNLPQPNMYDHPKTEEVMEVLKDNFLVLEELYIKQLSKAITPEAVVLGYDYAKYNNPSYHNFDIIAKGDRELLHKAFGKENNEGRALLAWASKDIQVGSTNAHKGDWYGTNVGRERLQMLIKKADETGNLQIRIAECH